MLSVLGSLPGSVSGPARGRRGAGLALAAAAAAGLLAGCASATSPHSASTLAAGQSTAKAQGQGQGGTGSASPAGTGTANSGGTATKAAVPGLGSLSLCQASALKVTVNAGQAGAAAGSTYVPVDFTNTASTPCGLYGFPGMSFVTAADGSGRQIGAAAQQNPGFGKVAVQLTAGGEAHAWLQVTQAANYPASTCQPVTAHWLRVYAPGETEALYVSHSFSACSSASVQLLTVMPVRSGQGVQGSTP